MTERTRHPAPSGLVPLSCNEIQHLFAVVVARPSGDLGHRLRWSAWRRRHQQRARTCHYDDRPPSNLRGEHSIRVAVPSTRAIHGDASATIGWLAERLGGFVDLTRGRTTAERLPPGVRTTKG